MKILVTGGAGFIGSHLVDRLIREGHQVTILDNLSTGFKENINPQAKFVLVDIRNLSQIKRYFQRQDFVFHLAALPRIQLSIKDPLPVNETNITGTLNVLLAAKEAGVKRVIYSASSSIYGNKNKLPLKEDMLPDPGSPYALSKYVGEEYCRLFTKLYGLDTIILRYFNVYGPRAEAVSPYATVIPIFLRQKAQGKPLTITGDGRQKRDFTYVDDVVEANIKAMNLKRRGNGEMINIGAGQNYSINQLAKIIGGPTIYIPSRPGESRVTLADNSKAKRILKWQPKISLEEGIKKTINAKN
jgi:UDP-glucose 4-epimerase